MNMNFCEAGIETPHSSMDSYYDLDVDQSDFDLSSGSSNLPFDFIDNSKPPMLSPSHVLYQPLPCDYHPILINQRKYTDSLSGRLTTQALFTNNDEYQLRNHLVLSSDKGFKNKLKSCKMLRKEGESNIESQELIQGAESETEKNKKIFFCQACGKSFKFQTSLLRHNNKVHNCKYQCTTCHRVFSRQAYLDVHTSKPGSSCFVNCYTIKRSQKQTKLNR